MLGKLVQRLLNNLSAAWVKYFFIDEAYRLSQGHFAQEAVDELVDNMTKAKFAGKMVIILAGYDNDMNNLLRVNEGLSSRFAEKNIIQGFEPGTLSSTT